MRGVHVHDQNGLDGEMAYESSQNFNGSFLTEPKNNLLHGIVNQSTNLDNQPFNSELLQQVSEEPLASFDSNLLSNKSIYEDTLDMAKSQLESADSKYDKKSTTKQPHMALDGTEILKKGPHVIYDGSKESKMLSDEVQYFSMVNYILLMILLLFYAIYRFNRGEQKKTAQPVGSHVKSKTMSTLTKFTFILSIFASIFLISLLIHIKLPLKNLEQGEIGDYQIKINREYYGLLQMVQSKTMKLKDGAKSLVDDLKSFLKRSFAKMSKSDAEQVDSKKTRKDSSISDVYNGSSTEQTNINTIEESNNNFNSNKTNQTYEYLSLTPLINISYSLSHILLISSVLLLTMVSYQKKDKLTLDVEKLRKDGNLRWLVISYAVLRIPLLIFLDYTAVSKNESVQFIKTVYYGFEGYVTASLVFSSILGMKKPKPEKSIELVPIKKGMPMKTEKNLMEKEDQFAIMRGIFYMILLALITNTFLKHTLQILSLPIKINQTFLYILNRIEELSGMIVGLGIIEGVTQ